MIEATEEVRVWDYGGLVPSLHLWPSYRARAPERDIYVVLQAYLGECVLWLSGRREQELKFNNVRGVFSLSRCQA